MKRRITLKKNKIDEYCIQRQSIYNIVSSVGDVLRRFCVVSTAFEGPVDSECKLFQEFAECVSF
jgi:hypothetical protein